MNEIAIAPANQLRENPIEVNLNSSPAEPAGLMAETHAPNLLRSVEQEKAKPAVSSLLDKVEVKKTSEQGDEVKQDLAAKGEDPSQDTKPSFLKKVGSFFSSVGSSIAGFAERGWAGITQALAWGWNAISDGFDFLKDTAKSLFGSGESLWDSGQSANDWLYVPPSMAGLFGMERDFARQPVASFLSDVWKDSYQYHYGPKRSMLGLDDGLLTSAALAGAIERKAGQLMLERQEHQDKLRAEMARKYAEHPELAEAGVQFDTAYVADIIGDDIDVAPYLTRARQILRDRKEATEA